jgi:hypothetical protein
VRTLVEPEESPPRIVKRAVSVLLCFCATVLAVPVGLPACFQEQCIRKLATQREMQVKEGTMLDADTWQSSAEQDDWLAFDGALEWQLFLPFQGRDLESVQVFISAQKSARDENGTVRSFALATGSLAEIAFVQSDRPENPAQLFVRNGTCAKYFVRVVAKARKK